MNIKTKRKMTVIERFLKYVSFDTQSDENSGATPSTPKQMVFAQYLRSELEQLGFQEIQACEMSRTIAKKTYEIELDTDYKKCFEEAYVTAMSDRKGPVYLDLPINACREHIEMDVTNSITINRCSAETQVDYIIKKLCKM